jgi:cytoskeleton protein RodZ
MASTPFGEHLKRERELRGVSLDEIAAATRIKTSFLEALENGRWQELPGGAFNRGFIRATSRFLGLDEEGMIAEYAIETGAIPQNKAAVPSGAMPRDYRPAIIAACATLLLIVVGAWFGHREYARHKQKRAATALAVVANSPTPTTAEAANPPSATPSGSIAAAPSDNPNNPQPAAKDSSTAAPVPIATRPTSPEKLQLKVEASKRTDVKIVGDGKTLFKGHLRSDAPKLFEAREGFEVSAADVNRVQLELNGKNIPFTETNGHRGSISLGRKDLASSTDSRP